MHGHHAVHLRTDYRIDLIAKLPFGGGGGGGGGSKLWNGLLE